MASAELKQIREALTKESIREHQLSKVGGAETDMFICNNCHGKNCTYTQVCLCLCVCVLGIASFSGDFFSVQSVAMIVGVSCAYLSLLLLPVSVCAFFWNIALSFFVLCHFFTV